MTVDSGKLFQSFNVLGINKNLEQSFDVWSSMKAWV